MLKRMRFYGLLLFLLVCSAISGYETGGGIVEPTEEVIEVPETVVEEYEKWLNEQ